MKVLHVHKLRGVGGSENHLLALLPALRERGIDARFLGLDDPEVGAPAIYAELDRLGVPHRQVVCGPDVSPRMARQVTAAVREEAPDLLHTHLVHADVYGAVAARRTGVPFVSSRHNDDRYLLGPFRVIDRRFASRALRLIAISNAVRRFLIEAGHPAAKIETIHYGLDALPSAPSEVAPPPAGPPLLLSIGRLTAQKDHPTNLRAFAEVRERHPEAVLAILGIGPLEAETRALVAELGLDGSVLLPGRVEIRDWLDRADLFVHTARWEGFGLVLLEAMLAALPRRRDPRQRRARGRRRRAHRPPRWSPATPPRWPRPSARCWLIPSGREGSARRAWSEREPASPSPAWPTARPRCTGRCDGRARRAALTGLGAPPAAVVRRARGARPVALPPLALTGGDGVSYDAMARHPLHAVAAYPAAARLAEPLLVSALPVSVAHGFLIVGVVSLILAGMVVGLIAHHVGLPPVLVAAASALVAGSYIGVFTAYDRYYVDAPLLLGVAVTLLCALHRRRVAFLCAALLTVFVKEIGVTLVVLPYLMWREPGRLLDRRALRTAILLAVPVVVAFVLLQSATPHLPPPHSRLTGVNPLHIFVRGVIVTTLNPIVALFGAVTLAWPLGFRRSPAALKRAHIWLLVAGPFLVLGSWERTLGPFLPFVVPAALFALRDATAVRAALFTLGSLAATAVAGSQTIGDGTTTVAHKLLLVSPGLLVAAAVLTPEYMRAIRARE